MSGERLADTFGTAAGNTCWTSVAIAAFLIVMVSPALLRASWPVDATTQLVTPGHAGAPPAHTTIALPGSSSGVPIANVWRTEIASAMVTPVRSRTFDDTLTSSMYSSVVPTTSPSQLESVVSSAAMTSLSTRSPPTGATGTIVAIWRSTGER